MGNLVRLESDGAVGVITLDNPPHNLIGDRFIDGYSAAPEDAVASGTRAILESLVARRILRGGAPAQGEAVGSS